MKVFEVQVSVPQKGLQKEPRLLDVELMASSPELAGQRTQWTLWSQHRHLSSPNLIKIISIKELTDGFSPTPED